MESQLETKYLSESLGATAEFFEKRAKELDEQVKLYDEIIDVCDKAVECSKTIADALGGMAEAMQGIVDAWEKPLHIKDGKNKFDWFTFWVIVGTIVWCVFWIWGVHYVSHLIFQ